MQRWLALSCGKMGDVRGWDTKVANGKIILTGLAASRDYWLRGMKIYERLWKLHPNDRTGLRHDLWNALMKLADIQRKMGNAAENEKYLRAAFDLFGSTRDSDRILFTDAPDLASSFSDMADLSAGKGDLDAARNFAARTLRIRDALARYDQQDFNAAVALQAAHAHLAQIEEGSKRYKEALQHYEEAQRILEQLPIDDPEHDRGDLRVQLMDLQAGADRCRKAMQ
jgi:tetratricopeptide (TPR) repeat protein